MTHTLKVNARNDIHLPAELLRHLNLGEDKMLKAQFKGNVLILVPVDLEPRYSAEALEGLDRLHEEEKKKGWIRLETNKDLDGLLK
ncbi:MAG: hypothetical protein A3G87_10220 [Omnitrophica bacterium RIFCSPLOWO2_12_FULL_50_11]|nr:MAG: hypothetical protein A3G87_10220 [Omnitrophica bacterium RIFCSPLOWO2_12_FULL_50_11]